MAPVVLNAPEPMTKVKVMTLKDYSEKILKTLQTLGVLHIEESAELEPTDQTAIEAERREINELLNLVSTILNHLPQKEQVALDEDIEVIYTRPFREISDEVKSLYNRVDKVFGRIASLSNEVKVLSDKKKYLEPLAGKIDVTLSDLEFSGDYLFAQIFTVSSHLYDTLKERLGNLPLDTVSGRAETETVIYIIAKQRDRKQIESIVGDIGGKTLQISDEDITIRGFLKTADERIGALDEEIKKLEAELNDKAREELKQLVLLREVLTAENERLAVLEKASEAKYVTLLEGWIPDSIIDDAIVELKESVNYIFIDTRKPEPEEEAPTKYQNPRFFKPFQVIINLFGTPKYREWDPTPVISYSFAIFFALMVADAVYALGVLLVAKFLLPKMVDDPETDTFKLLQNILYISGSVALVLGVLSGSYLGNIYQFLGIESMALVNAVEATLQNPLRFIILSLLLGIVHVNIGHTLALIKAIKMKNKGAIINKTGTILLQFGIPFLLNSMLKANVPGFNDSLYAISSYLMYAGIVLLIIGTLIERGGLGVILWIFDLTGILGDIMSYSRLAGVGLATYYLASSFNVLAELFRSLIPGAFGLIVGTILAIGILIFGHLVNLLLGIITGFIHSLRLCFVEFLFKFFEGGGKDYSPFKLRKRKSVPVATE